jgi:hypothetical protein
MMSQVTLANVTENRREDFLEKYAHFRRHFAQ